MKHKKAADFTAEEKEWMDTIAVNYIVAQSDGFQLGYAQAITVALNVPEEGET